jgi:hypothetical protein
LRYLDDGSLAIDNNAAERAYLADVVARTGPHPAP